MAKLATAIALSLTHKGNAAVTAADAVAAHEVT